MWRIGVNARFKSLGGQSPADTFAARARASGRCAVYDGAQSFPSGHRWRRIRARDAAKKHLAVRDVTRAADPTLALTGARPP
jgi:hypothetical protein